MMDPRERIEAFWRGERPDQIPYTIYWWEWWETSKDPAWLPMFKDGLRVTLGVPTAAEQMRNVEYKKTTYCENGDEIQRETMKTPVGEIYATSRNGWHDSYWLKEPEDYRVMRYIVQHTDIIANYDAPAQMAQGLGEYGMIHGHMPRTPLQTILVDYAGLQNFGVHLLMYEEEVRDLYDALLENFRKSVEIVARSKELFIACMENFTAETLGPERYKEFLLPVYAQYFPILQQAGKIVGTHYDGKIASCKDQVATAPIDIIESFTTPPEGDMTLNEARAAWGSKRIWSNINVSDYALEPTLLRQRVLDAVQQAAPDGKGLAFEVSEHIPQNWRESIPVVLDALKETRR